HQGPPAPAGRGHRAGHRARRARGARLRRPRYRGVTRVLVTGAGSGLGNNVIRSLRAAEPGLVVVGAHSDRFLLKKSDADVSYLVPPAHDAAHAAALRRLVARE